VAALVHGKALRDNPAFIAIATSYSVMTLDHQRLSLEAATLVLEVQNSRVRIQSTADDERRRIERDIHDGAQQRLVALRIRLELAAEHTERDDPDRAKDLRALGTDAETAIDEVRDLARGIYPGVLADRGLVAALRSAAQQSALTTTVLAAGVQRYSREMERSLLLLSRGSLEHRQARARRECSRRGPLRQRSPPHGGTRRRSGI